MKFRHFIIVSLLLAILTIGAVSAAEDIASDDLAASDDGVDIDEAPIDDVSTDDVIAEDDEGPESGNGTDFDADVEDEVGLDCSDSVLDIYTPETGNISISISKDSVDLSPVTREVSEVSVDNDPVEFTLSDLGITETGTYFISAKFIQTNGTEVTLLTDHELTVTDVSNVYDVIEFADDFYLEDPSFVVITLPIDVTEGRIVVYVDSDVAFNKTLSQIGKTKSEADENLYEYSIALGELDATLVAENEYYFEVEVYLEDGADANYTDSTYETVYEGKTPVIDLRDEVDYYIYVADYVLTNDETTNMDIYIYSDYLPAGNITVLLDGNTPIINQQLDWSLYWRFMDCNIPKGEHYVQFVYEGDENYSPFTSEKYYFTYDDVIIDVPSEILVGSYDEPAIVVRAINNTGNILLLINNEEFFKSAVSDVMDPDDDYFYIYLDNLTFGTYNYTLAYTNGNKNITLNGSFVVDYIFKVECEAYELEDPIYYGEDTRFDVRLPNGATGTISVVVANKTLTFEYDEEESIVISTLDLGENYLNFTYSGDSNLQSKSYLYEIKTTARIQIPYEFTYNGDEVIELILPANANGNLSVYLAEYDYDLGDYNYTLIDSVKLVDGKVAISLSDLPLGEYDISAEYTGEDYDVDDKFTTVRILPKVTYDEYIWRNATSQIIIESPEDIKGNFTITLIPQEVYDPDREEDIPPKDEPVVLYEGPVNATITLTLPKLNDTRYTVHLIYNGNDSTVDTYYFIRVMNLLSKWDMNATFIKEVNKYDDEKVFVVIIDIPNELRYAMAYLYVDEKLFLEDELYYYGDSDDTYSIYADLSDFDFGTHSVKLVVVPSYYFENQTAESTFEVTWVTVPEKIRMGDYIDYDMYDKNATGTLSLLIDGKDYAMEFVENGVATIDFEDLSFGEHTYTITYSGDKTHARQTKSGKFNFTQLFYIDNIDEGDVLSLMSVYPIGISFDDDATGNVTVTIGNQTQTAVISKGYAEVNFTGLKEGDYTVIAKYSGDSKYPAAEISCNFTIEGYWVICGFYEDGIFFELLLPSNATGNLSVYSGAYDSEDLIKTVELKDGYARINITDSDLGYSKYYLRGVYEGDSVEAFSTWMSYKKKADVYISEWLSIGEDAKVEIALDNVTGNVTILVNGETYITLELNNSKINTTIPARIFTGEDNVIILQYVGENADAANAFKGYDYEMEMYFPIEYYVFVEPKNMTIPETIDSDGNGTITFELPANYSGNVTVIVNGEPVSTTPVNGGNVTIPISNLPKGENSIEITVAGDDGSNYTSSGVTVVPKDDAQVSTSTPSGSTTPIFYVNMPREATGTVIVNINGVNYGAELVDGSASITPTGLPDGDYTATIRYSGDANYAPFNKTNNVTIKTEKISPPGPSPSTNTTNTTNTTNKTNTTDTSVAPVIKAANMDALYTAGTKYSVTVYGTDGKVAANTKVTFYINGKKFKTVTTNAKGVAFIKITQKPGSYKIKVTALGKSVTKKLKVKHVLKLQKVNVKRSAKKLVIKATLSKVNGKYLKGKKITLKFKGKKFKAKTNKKGVAKFTIKSKVLSKLKKGKKVTYKATYKKDTVKRTVKVKK